MASRSSFGTTGTSGQRDTEIWKFGAVAETILADIIKWRASIKPYLHQEMVKMNATGRCQLLPPPCDDLSSLTVVVLLGLLWW